MPKDSNRRRKGRWAPDSVVNALERRYALILGLHDTIERECEPLSGAALMEAQDRIESEKILMRRTLDAIATVGWEFDPDWQPSRVKPIYPRRTYASTGNISKTAWIVMREAARPMTAREIARATVQALGEAEEEWVVARFDVAIRAALHRAEGEGGVYIIEGATRLFGLLPEEAL